jgi:hypothetical protein
MACQPLNNTVLLMNDSPGSIKLKQGPLPGSPEIELTGALPTDALTLSCGLPPAAAQVKLSGTGIELSFGPPVGGAKLTLNQEGITLKVGILSTLKVTPAGVEIEGIQMKEQFQTLVESTRLALEENTRAMTTIKAAVQNIS